VLRWLRERTTAGMTISQAIQQLRSLGDEALAAAAPGVDHGPRHFDALGDGLLAALLAFDRQAANAVIEEAYALYRLEEVCLRLFRPVLVEIGERWHRHEATIAQERFASHLIQGRLAALLHAYAPAAGRGLIITACAPDELHELGILMLSVFLVHRAWQVVYLGANVPIADLVQTVARLQPALVCLSATSGRTAQTLTAAAQAIAQLPEPRAPVAFGGDPFNTDPELRAPVKGRYLGADAQAAVNEIERLLG
jgi:methanogenic corrinoid protein MtbC1